MMGQCFVDYLKQNYDYWQSQYETKYPDTTLVKFYHHMMKGQIKDPSTLKVLDYGCSNGTNAFFFRDLGFDVYGVDINKIAIDKARKQAEHFGIQDHFSSIDSKVDKDDIFFEGNFDLILSWATLYYFSDGDLQTRLRSLYNNLKPQGYFIATMVGAQTGSFADTNEAFDGLRKVPIIERIKDIHGREHFVNFTASSEELLRKFKLFSPLHIGYIDESFSVSKENKNNLFHYIFVGKK